MSSEHDASGESPGSDQITITPTSRIPEWKIPERIERVTQPVPEWWEQIRQRVPPTFEGYYVGVRGRERTGVGDRIWLRVNSRGVEEALLLNTKLGNRMYTDTEMSFDVLWHLLETGAIAHPPRNDMAPPPNDQRQDLDRVIEMIDTHYPRGFYLGASARTTYRTDIVTDEGKDRFVAHHLVLHDPVEPEHQVDVFTPDIHTLTGIARGLIGSIRPDPQPHYRLLTAHITHQPVS